MPAPILATKLYIPPPRPKIVLRPRLTERLNEGLHRKLTLISAPAGYGKTTLVTEWIGQIQAKTACTEPAEVTEWIDQNQKDTACTELKDTACTELAEVTVCWLSLDEDDSDSQLFFSYLAAAIRPLRLGSVPALPDAQSTLPPLLQSPQPLPAKSLMTAFVNDLIPVSTPFHLILDDYHAVDNPEIDAAIAFLIDHMPPQMMLVITSRTDPGFPISRLRARGHLTELRADDLRFTEAEAAQFLQQSMGLTLLPAQIAALESRTEGWIAGLQMAALSMQNRDDVDGFVTSFTGSHRFIMDYLVEEVLNQQPAEVQNFLLQTAVLTRLCADLCDAVRQTPPASQQILDQLDNHNIFLIPLDNERHWYRYHHLFADLLRQRLQQSTASSPGDAMAEYHSRASQWYEENGLEIEAFHHAAAANDVERAARLVEGEGMPLYFRGAMAPVMNWLESLPTTVLDARPSLLVTYASALTFVGQGAAAEQKLQAAEAALQGPDPESNAEPDDKTRDLIGHIAATRAMLAIPQNQVETIIAQSRRALAYLHPDNLPVRTATTWTLGYAYQIQGDRAAASQAYAEAIAISQASGNIMITLAAATGLGQVQETENQLYPAAENYRSILRLVGDPPWPAACEAHLGLARLFYEWNDLDAAQQHGHQGLQLARQLDNIDTPASCGLLLARLKFAQRDVAGATAILDEADQFVRRHNFVHQMPEVAAAQVLLLLRQGNLAAAAHLAETHELPISQARVHLAQGDASAALAALEPLHRQVAAKNWADEVLKVMALQAVAHHAHGEKEKALQLLDDALVLAEPGGFIRTFVDEGPAMAQLLTQLLPGAAARGIMPGYTSKLLAAFEAEEQKNKEISTPPPAPSTQPLIDPLSKRELEILALIAAGLKNKEIAEQLVISLNTVLYHIKNIYSKLGVNKRTLAIIKARELNLI